MLHLLDRRDKGSATSTQVAAALRYVESFLVRRLLVGRATNNLNRILLSAVTEMSTNLDVDVAVRRYLSTGRKYFATDAELRAGVRSIPFYLNGRPNQRALVLRWLEESYGSKEPVTLKKLTIEHVLPQSPTSEWRSVIRAELKPDERVDDVYEGLVHTLGNLTLTGYNTPLSNKPFTDKRLKLASSGLAMNQEIGAAESWGRQQILARADDLALRAQKLWPGPMAAVSTGQADVPWEVMNLLNVFPKAALRQIWPLAVYPSGRIEVVFQHLLTRPPFDDLALREQLRTRLNHIDGIELPIGKLEMRPSFDLGLLANGDRSAQLMHAVIWFTERIREHQSEQVPTARDVNL